MRTPYVRSQHNICLYKYVIKKTFGGLIKTRNDNIFHLNKKSCRSYRYIALFSDIIIISLTILLQITKRMIKPRTKEMRRWTIYTQNIITVRKRQSQASGKPNSSKQNAAQRTGVVGRHGGVGRGRGGMPCSRVQAYSSPVLACARFPRDSPAVRDCMKGRLMEYELSFFLLDA